MKKKMPACPSCDSTDAVYKVSQLYMAGITPADQMGQEERKLLNAAFRVEEVTEKNRAEKSREIRAFIKAITPPASRKELFREVQPDLIMAVFGAVGAFMVYQVYLTQPGFIGPAVGLYVAFVVVYFATRSRLNEEFNKRREESRERQRKIERGIQRWMNLYYCANEKMLFEQGRDEMVVPDLLENYLFS